MKCRGCVGTSHVLNRSFPTRRSSDLNCDVTTRCLPIPVPQFAWDGSELFISFLVCTDRNLRRSRIALYGFDQKNTMSFLCSLMQTKHENKCALFCKGRGLHAFPIRARLSYKDTALNLVFGAGNKKHIWAESTCGQPPNVQWHIIAGPNWPINVAQSE